MNGKETIQIAYTPHTSSTPYVLWLSNHLCTSFQIDPGSKTWFRFGSERFLVTCESKLDDTFGFMVFPEELALNHILPSPHRTYTLTYHVEKNELQVGPILSMLVEKRGNQEDEFGKLTDFASELNEYCQQHHALFYMFSIDDVAGDRISGYRFNGTELLKEIFPFPDVIYNRISNRTFERSEPCVEFFNRCQDWGIPYFNDRFLSKWDVFKLLVNRDALAAHLPKTIQLKEEKSILELLNAFPSLFLKPIDGSEGRGILRITRQFDSQFRLDASKALDPPLPLLSEQGILAFINQYVPVEHYILQQGIPLIQQNDGYVDFRILCNRNEYGIWCITSSTARVGTRNRIVTNVSSGARIEPLMDVLEKQFPIQKAKYIRSVLFELAIETAYCIHEKANGIFGEFGIDFGVDKEGHVWIFEVNSKPSKHASTQSETTEIRPSAKGVFLFANYLYTTSSHERNHHKSTR